MKLFEIHECIVVNLDKLVNITWKEDTHTLRIQNENGKTEMTNVSKELWEDIRERLLKCNT